MRAVLFASSSCFLDVDTLLTFMVFLAMATDKQTIMREAQKFIAKGQYDKAIAEWKKLLRESPNDPNIYNTVGDLCLKKNSKAEAVDAYKRAADILAQDGFTSKAIALYKKVLNIDPNKIEVHLALGDMNAEKGLTGNALESYKLVADHFTRQKDTVKALGIYQKMADLNPSDVAFRIKLGDMYSRQNMTSEAAKAYLDAADVHMSKEAFKDARQLFEKVLAIDPDNWAVYYKAGIVYLKEGKFSEAYKALKPAFEKDPANRELTDAYLDALTKAGRENDAEQVIKNILAEDATRTELNEKLYLIYIGKKDYDRALEVASSLADSSVEQGNHDGAVEILKKFVAACPHFSPGRQKLGEIYVSLHREQDASATFLQTAEILADEGDQEGAKAVLYRTLEINPSMEEARELLGRLTSSVLTPPPPQPVLEEPIAPVVAARPVEPEPAVDEPAAEMAEPAAVEAPVTPAPALEAEDPAVSAALTEADVLVKYGLATKALEQLESLALRFAESVSLRTKLRDIYGDLGQMGNAAAHMLVLADLYTKRGMPDQAQEVLQSALAIDPSNSTVMSRLGITPASAASAAPAAEALDPLSTPLHAESGPAEFQSAEQSPAFEPPPAFEEPAPSFEETSPFNEPAPTDELVIEGLDGEMPAAEAVDVIAFGEPPAASGIPEAAVQDRASVQDQATEIDVSEIWAEAEFYYQQGLFDEAKKHYAKIVELNPGERRAIARLADISREEEDTIEFTRLAEAVESLEGAIAAGPAEAGQELPLSASDEDAVRKLMSEISQLKTPGQKAAPQGPAEPNRAGPQPLNAAPPQFTPPEMKQGSAASVTPADHGAEEDFLDLGVEITSESKTGEIREQAKEGTDDFFDLASELRDELSNIAVPARPGASVEEQSLDEIFEEFKRGVEQQSSREDVDTHYNLGVAYKEMGLLDDAIGEFILTPVGEPKYVQGRYMLGLCYMEKGEYENAIGELQNALTCSGKAGEDEASRVGIHYDLGLAYQGAGSIGQALSEFQKVHSMDPGYRDIQTKLKDLKQGGYISPNKLKDDIEKEISEKFLEEGERIEREEKHRKNEKVRN